MEHLINLDKELFFFLNGLGSEPFDGFWKIITKQIYWTPLFLAVFYLLQQKLKLQQISVASESFIAFKPRYFIGMK